MSEKSRENYMEVHNMSKKKAKKMPKKTFFDTKEKKIGAGVAAALIIILIAVLMFIETVNQGNLYVKNDTEMKLEYVKTKYISGEYDLTQYITTKSISANKDLSMKTEPVDFTQYKANYNIVFKFEGHEELTIDAGDFSNKFSGDMKIVFDKTDDDKILKMTVKAKTGLLASKLIQCDEEYTVDLARGVVYDK